MKPFLLLAANVAAFNLAVWAGGLTGALTILATVLADVMFVVCDLDALRRERYEQDSKLGLAGKGTPPKATTATSQPEPWPYDWERAS